MTDTKSTTPVDFSRTTRQHAGETMKDGHNAPGLVATALGLVALVVGLFALAAGYTVAGVVAVAIALVLGVVGMAWVLRAHNRVRAAEVEWHEEHSSRPAPPPTS